MTAPADLRTALRLMRFRGRFQHYFATTDAAWVSRSFKTTPFDIPQYGLEIAVTAIERPEVVTHCPEPGLFFGAERAGLELHNVRQVLMVITRRANDTFCIGAIDKIENTEQHHRRDPAAAGRAQHENAAWTFNECRRHRR
jgi:hypothetical protein